MNRENSSAIRHGVLALAWVCAVSWTCAPCGESEALLKDEPRYEVHPLIDDQCNRIAWYVKESTIHKQEDEAADQCNVWRMRARASLCSYRRNSNAISLAVRLTVNPTIRNMIREGCFVERIVGAESQDFTFECRVGDYRQSLALVSNTISPVAGKNGTMTMCAYGKEPLLKEGSTLECALFLDGLESLVFVYRVDAGGDVRNVRIPIPADLQSDSANACRGIVSIYDARRSVTVSVKSEKILSKEELFLMLTFQSSGELVTFPISVKNVLSLREAMKAQKNRLCCRWSQEVTERDRSPLFF